MGRGPLRPLRRRARGRGEQRGLNTDRTSSSPRFDSLSRKRIELLLSWRRSGFSVHNRVFTHPGDGREFEALVRYMMRATVSLSRLRFTPGAKEVVASIA
jgi:hypothetical protein